MTRTSKWCLRGGVVVLAMMLVGCGAKDEQIMTLQRENADLVAERDEIYRKYEVALRDAESARANALRIQQMLDDCNRQLASRPTTIMQPPAPRPVQPIQPVQTGPRISGEWKELDNIAWIDVGSDILFDSGKNTLKNAAKSKLAEVANRINSSYGGREVLVIGHTDSDPIRKTKNLWKDNLDLSQGRSWAVAHELVKLGVSKDHIIAGGAGEWRPLSSGTKAQNRRVQIVAVKLPD